MTTFDFLKLAGHIIGGVTLILCSFAATFLIGFMITTGTIAVVNAITNFFN